MPFSQNTEGLDDPFFATIELHSKDVNENGYGIWGIFASILAYTGYAVYKDWMDRKTGSTRMLVVNNTVNNEAEIDPQAHEIVIPNNHVGSFDNNGERIHIVRMKDDEWFTYRRWRDRKIKQSLSPQAEEVSTQPVRMGTTVTQEQNVKFLDTHPGYMLEEKSNFDELRDHALSEDASLDEFFSRPIRIKTFDWNIGGGAIDEVFNPWQLYFENPRVINRIANYRLMRSKLHVKVMISGNGFHYGRALVSYNPLPNTDALSQTRVGVLADAVLDTQKPKIFLDPTNSQGGELVLPFFYYRNVLDITTSEWRNMGTLKLSVLNDIKHANGASEGVTINVFAWAEDAKFAIPTHQEPNSITPQADEYTNKPVSYTAGVISNIAKALQSVPLISPFARATEIGADAVGAMASIFGFSRPVDLETCIYRPVTKQNMATTNSKDDAAKLTVDQKQELTIDPRTAGLDATDEMDINFIASRESYFQAFPWAVSTSTEQLLWNCVVDPGLFDVNDGGYHLPACAYAALPFKYWRGSMKYRFQVVCSKYHKGRLKIVYDPVGTAGSTAEYNTAYTTIIDIADQTDFTIQCGWGQPTTYRESLGIASVVTSIISSTSTLGYNSSIANYGNGTISVYVVNELAVPNDTINNDIEINVFVSMGDDFEVAVPEAGRLQRLRLSNATILDPQAEEVGMNNGDETDRVDSKPHHAPVINTMSSLTSKTDKTNLVHFGEHIRSFRQLVKRYNLSEMVPFSREGGPGNLIEVRSIRNALPLDPGYTSLGGDLTETVGAEQYFYAYMTFQRYATLAYGGWRGSMRWLLDASNILVNQTGDDFRLAASTSFESTAVTDQQRLFLNQVGPLAKAEYYEFNRNIHGHNGVALVNTTNNPTLNFEVPYYSELRFTPAKQKINFDDHDDTVAMPQFSTIVSGTAGPPSDNFQLHCAAGEDFTTFMYLGPPVLYYEGSYPQF